VAYSVPEHVRDDEAMLAHLRSMPLECAEAVARLSAGLCARMTEEARNAGLAGDVAQSQALLMRGGGVAQFLREFCRLREEPGGEDGGEDGGGGAGGALEGGW
jgi:hypothetical protein